MSMDKNMLRKMWDSVLQNFNMNISAESERVERAIGFSRLYDQLWSALDESENGWAYPLDVFVGDDGTSLFSIVAQKGKLFQVPMTVTQDTLSLGEWVQVTEVFQPVTQSRFSVQRQKDGTYRWLCIAGTTVLNRVGEIDSSELFDSFVARAQKTGSYPRLDFYHLGETDPKTWEFGTADYLAREGVCYIASGTFDTNHPLAEAMIRSCEAGCDEWGNSIEFYAYAEPEILVMDPKIQVPIYKEGENIRISVVLEEDAAGLFTRMVEIREEKNRTMDPRTEAALRKLFGDDEEAIAAFVENVDAVNRTVKNDKLIHRKKKEEPVADDTDDDDEDAENDVNEEETEKPKDGVPDSLILDEVATKEIATQVVQSGVFSDITQSLKDLTTLVTKLTEGQVTADKEISRLKTVNKKLAERVEALGAEETVKKQTWAEDLPARRQIAVTYRRREQEDAIEEEAETSGVIAQRILEKLPSY